MFFNLNQFLAVLMTIFFINSFIFPVLFAPFMLLTIVSFYVTLKQQRHVINKQIICVFFIAVISLVVPVVKNNSLYDLKIAILLLCSMLFSYTLAHLKPIKSELMCWLPLLIALIMFTSYLLTGRDAEEFFPLNSRNFVSITLFLGLFAYFSLSKNYNVNGKVIVISFVICFFCIYAVGRAGIFLSFILLACNLLLFVMGITRGLKKRTKLLMQTSMFLSVCFTLIFLIYYLYNNDFLARVISRGINDHSRESIIKEYLSNLDGISLILGVRLSELELMYKFNNNLHNSFLSMHSLFGLIYSLFFMFLVAYSLVLSWRRKYYPIVLLMLILLGRGAADIQVLAGRGDWIFYFIVFYLIQSQKKKVVKKQ